MDEHIFRISGGFTRRFSGEPARNLSGETDPIYLYGLIPGTWKRENNDYFFI